MCDKDTLNLITEKVCAAAKEVLGDRLEKVILFGKVCRRKNPKGLRLPSKNLK
jgi:hypothetical protein